MSSAVVDALIQGFQDALLSRYCSAVGFVIVLFENLITFDAEYQYVWKGPRSFAKFAFLVNRYVTPIIFIVVAIEMCGSINGIVFSDTGCRAFLVVTQCVGSIEIMAANMVALQRVLALWKGNKSMTVFLYTIYTLSICVSVSLLILAMKKIAPNIAWNAYVSTCVINDVPTAWPAMWGAPMFFELTILSCVIIHAFASPRSAQLPLARALHQDGIGFFLAVVVLRVANMSIAISVRTSLKLVAIFIIWSLETTLLNRFVLRQRQFELSEEARYAHHGSGFTRESESYFGHHPELELTTIDDD